MKKLILGIFVTFCSFSVLSAEKGPINIRSKIQGKNLSIDQISMGGAIQGTCSETDIKDHPIYGNANRLGQPFIFSDTLILKRGLNFNALAIFALDESTDQFRFVFAQVAGSTGGLLQDSDMKVVRSMGNVIMKCKLSEFPFNPFTSDKLFCQDVSPKGTSWISLSIN